MENLDSIFLQRFGGSINIRGISYQILYSIYKSFELFIEGTNTITLEGIEDLDLKGLHLNNNTFIQIKTSDNEWKWNQLRLPLTRFLEVYKLNTNSKFVLILNRPFKGDIEVLSRYDKLNLKEKIAIETNFVRLCKKFSKDSKETLIQFLKQISIECIPDEKLTIELKRRTTEYLHVQTDSSEIYLGILISNFIEWAKQRKTINKTDIQNLIINAIEKISIEKEFQAVGKGLISKVSWDTNYFVDDYYEGKNTNASHISAGADYKRIKWLEVIHKSLINNKVTIVKGSSGQGKSTLLYRYAYDYWLKENTYKLNALNVLEHVELVKRFLVHRANLKLPVLVLIDNINVNVLYWNELIKNCVGFDIHFLMTVRKEDWFRFGKESLQFEVIEPILDLEEAKEIFHLFQTKGKVKHHIKSAEIAFEKIGNSRLLIEYIYLLTQGEMLHDRLKDQVNQFHRNREDASKIDLLRKVVLAGLFNIPLRIEDAIKTIKFKSDPQQVIESLNGEYLHVENRLLYGFHWVRTEHLYKILFDNYAHPISVALEILSSIPKEHIKDFISGLLSEFQHEKEIVINGLKKNINAFELSTIIAVLEGFYIAGERNYFYHNKKIFDKANFMLGHNGPGFLATDLTIATEGINIIDSMIEIEGQEGNWAKLKELHNQIEETERGLQYCCNFLRAVIDKIKENTIINDCLSSAKLLDTICFCKIKHKILPQLTETVLRNLDNFENCLVEEFILFIQALYKHDKHILMQWYDRHSNRFIKYLKLKFDLMVLEVGNETLFFKFILDFKDTKTAHEQAIERVKILRETFPFIKKISCEGIYMVPKNMIPSHDESVKNITVKNFYFKRDVDRNRVFLDIIDSHYMLDSYYEYQDYLFSLRKNIISFFSDFNVMLTNMARKIKQSKRTYFEEGTLPERILELIKKMPSVPPQTNQLIKESIEKAINNWFPGIKGFILQIDKFIEDLADVESLRLSLINLNNAIEELSLLHAATKEICNISPDYFGMLEIQEMEINVYKELYDLVELVFKINPKDSIKNPLQYIHLQRKTEIDNHIKSIKKVFLGYIDNYIFSDTIVGKGMLKYYSIIFKVDNIETIHKRLVDLLLILSNVSVKIDYYFLIPLKENKKIVDGHYFISYTVLDKIRKGETVSWESFVPITYSKELISGLPEYELESQDNPEWKILNSAILLDLHCLDVYQKCLIKYLDSNDEFEKILIKNHRERMSGVFQGTLENIEKVKIQLSAINGESDRLNTYNVISNESKSLDIFNIDFSKICESITSMTP